MSLNDWKNMDLKTIDNPTYYEKYNWDKANLDESLKRKIKKIREILPQGIHSIADIGCGDGTITQQIKNNHFIVGIDRSKTALMKVILPRILSSADQLAIKDNSFDLVLSSELLEHLEDDIFNSTLEEIKRISRKYILLTFPNAETIEKDFVKCPNCGNVFNKSYHLRKLTVQNITPHFKGYKIVTQFEYGKGKRRYKKWLLKIKHKFVSSESWIPNRWTSTTSRETMCPKCEMFFILNYKFSLLGFILDGLNTILSPFNPYWRFLLLEKS